MNYYIGILQTQSGIQEDTGKGKGKSRAIPIQALDGPWGFQEVEDHRFQNNRHMKVALAAFTPQEVPWYPFLLEAESTPGA